MNRLNLDRVTPTERLRPWWYRSQPMNWWPLAFIAVLLLAVVLIWRALVVAVYWHDVAAENALRAEVCEAIVLGAEKKTTCVEMDFGAGSFCPIPRRGI